MNLFQTPLGEVFIAPQPELFQYFATMIQEVVAAKNYPPGVALTGGSSPKAFYTWLSQHPERLPEARSRVVFTVSDERCVPMESEESNYGNAQRLFFDTIGVDFDNRFPWDTSRTPADAANWYEKLWALSFGEGHAYDICMLGMGDDAHTASLFPNSPLLTSESMKNNSHLFAAVHVSGKGDRLTITPAGLQRCGRVVILVTGAAKANTLHRVFHGEEAPVSEIPIRFMSTIKDQVVWLLDPDAGSKLVLA